MRQCLVGGSCHVPYGTESERVKGLASRPRAHHGSADVAGYAAAMKLGWLHDDRNDLKWTVCQAAHGQGMRVGVHWYLTDAPVVAQGTAVHRALNQNYATALANACRILEHHEVVDVHFTHLVPPNRGRGAWTADAIAHFQERDVTFVLLDPDTGIALGDAGREHASPEEVCSFVTAFDQGVIFQFNQRAMSRHAHRTAIATRLQSCLAGRTITFLDDSGYFLIHIR
jgi:hypothetical protein